MLDDVGDLLRINGISEDVMRFISKSAIDRLLNMDVSFLDNISPEDEISLVYLVV